MKARCPKCNRKANRLFMTDGCLLLDENGNSYPNSYICLYCGWHGWAYELIPETEEQINEDNSTVF